MPTLDREALQQRLQRRRDRVRDHSSVLVNRRIDQLTEASVEATVRGGRDAVIKRIAELDHEWDIDRALMVQFAVVGGTTAAVGVNHYGKKPFLRPRRKGVLYLLSAQFGFLMLHGLAGWCPPVVLLRRLGFRTKSEIEAERSALMSALDREAAH